MIHWVRKFKVALGGIAFAVTDQVSFWVHLPIAVSVCAVAAWLRVDRWEWVAIIVAISSVLVAELLNSAIELLVRAVHPEEHPLVGKALDVSAGAVLLAVMAAIATGLTVLGPPLYAVILGSM